MKIENTPERIGSAGPCKRRSNELWKRFNFSKYSIDELVELMKIGMLFSGTSFVCVHHDKTSKTVPN